MKMIAGVALAAVMAVAGWASGASAAPVDITDPKGYDFTVTAYQENGDRPYNTRFSVSLTNQRLGFSVFEETLRPDGLYADGRVIFSESKSLANTFQEEQDAQTTYINVMSSGAGTFFEQDFVYNASDPNTPLPNRPPSTFGTVDLFADFSFVLMNGVVQSYSFDTTYGSGSSGSGNPLDQATLAYSGLSAVPLPATLPMFSAALLALSGLGYGLRRTRSASGQRPVATSAAT